MKGHPMLHDFFSSILDYKSKTVHKLLEELGIFKVDKPIHFTRKECPIYIKKSDSEEFSVFADVVWILGEGEDAIIHEVKTGNYSLEEIYEKYKNGTVRIKTKTNVYNVKNHTLYIWGWSEYHQENLASLGDAREDILYKIREGEINLVPLEILIPLSAEIMDEMRSVFTKNILTWNPKEDYVKNVKLKVWDKLWESLLRNYKLIGLWSRIEPDKLNIIIEHEYKEDYTLITEFEILKEGGSFPPSALDGEVINAYVPVMCEHCNRAYFLLVDIDNHGGNEKSMGPETLWTVTYDGWCPICNSPMELDVEIWEYPVGRIEAIEVITRKGLKFPTKEDIRNIISQLTDKPSKKADKDRF